MVKDSMAYRHFLGRLHTSTSFLSNTIPVCHIANTEKKACMIT